MNIVFAIFKYFPHGGMRQQRFLHLANLHAVSHVLDLAVLASQYHQLAIFPDLPHIAA